MTTPNAELIERARRIARVAPLDHPERQAFNLSATITTLCDALAASDARVAELERVEAALIAIIRNVHGHLLDDRIDAARSAP